MRALCRYWEAGALPVGWVLAAAPAGGECLPTWDALRHPLNPLFYVPTWDVFFCPFPFQLYQNMEVMLI